MASRSTRNKLRFSADKALGDMERAIEHLSFVDYVAADLSPSINAQLPALVTLLVMAKDMLQSFRDSL